VLVNLNLFICSIINFCNLDPRVVPHLSDPMAETGGVACNLL
jgi:hypothetical protein